MSDVVKYNFTYDMVFKSSLSNHPKSVIRLSGEKDPDEYIVANGKDAYIDNLNHTLTYFEFKMNYLKQNKDLNKIEDQSEYIKEVLSEIKDRFGITNEQLVIYAHEK